MKIRKNKPVSAEDLQAVRIKNNGKGFFLKTPAPNRKNRRLIHNKERFMSNKSGECYTIVNGMRFIRKRHKVEVWKTKLVKPKDIIGVAPEMLITKVIKKDAKGKKYKKPKTVYRQKVEFLGHRWLENYYPVGATKAAA